MVFGVRRALVAFACLLALGGSVSYAQTPLDHPTVQSAAEELAEAQFRRQLLESRRLSAQKGSDDLYLMIEREGKRVLPPIFLFVIVCLVLFFVFALPLSERDKTGDSDEPVDTPRPGPEA